MSFEQFVLYAKYFAALIAGIIIGRLTMAIQYALIKPKPK